MAYDKDYEENNLEVADEFDEDDDPIADILYEIVTRMGFEEMRPETVFTLSQTRRPPTGAACKRRNHER